MWSFVIPPVISHVCVYNATYYTVFSCPLKGMPLPSVVDPKLIGVVSFQSELRDHRLLCFMFPTAVIGKWSFPLQKPKHVWFEVQRRAFFKGGWNPRVRHLWLDDNLSTFTPQGHGFTRRIDSVATRPHQKGNMASGVSDVSALLPVCLLRQQTQTSEFLRCTLVSTMKAVSDRGKKSFTDPCLGIGLCEVYRWKPRVCVVVCLAVLCRTSGRLYDLIHFERIYTGLSLAYVLYCILPVLRNCFTQMFPSINGCSVYSVRVIEKMHCYFSGFSAESHSTPLYFSHLHFQPVHDCFYNISSLKFNLHW